MQDSDELKRLKKEKGQRLKKLHSEEKVKIKALRAIRPESLGGRTTIKEGEECEVAVSEAKEFCERPFNGYSGESGMKTSAYAQTKIFRAEYVR